MLTFMHCVKLEGKKLLKTGEKKGLTLEQNRALILPRRGAGLLSNQKKRKVTFPTELSYIRPRDK